MSDKEIAQTFTFIGVVIGAIVGALVTWMVLSL